MSRTVIKIEALSKRYRLGLVGSGTLKDDLKGLWYRARGKEDPTLKIGEENRLDTRSGKYIWALRDINLEVKEGDVLGIIGKNGAGKTTLLKILSRVTGPSTGVIRTRGRIASLLEVGTGMHPELTGRENVFLNGAILGMTKHEIKAKFDEIVDFAGVARYIDTPVKRYSSGMHVRLGFAVAAFLEPEILIVDEVLAVGDTEFQKKAIGKMQDVSQGQGRTVLFVSHNMSSINTLCHNAVLLNQGKMLFHADVKSTIDRYLTEVHQIPNSIGNCIERKGNQVVKFIDFYAINSQKERVDRIIIGELVELITHIKVGHKMVNNIDIGISIHSSTNDVLSIMYSSYQNKVFNLAEGFHKIILKIPVFAIYDTNLIFRGRITVNKEVSDWPTYPLAKLPCVMGNMRKGISSKSGESLFLIEGEWDILENC